MIMLIIIVGGHSLIEAQYVFPQQSVSASHDSFWSLQICFYMELCKGRSTSLMLFLCRLSHLCLKAVTSLFPVSSASQHIFLLKAGSIYGIFFLSTYIPRKGGLYKNITVAEALNGGFTETNVKTSSISPLSFIYSTHCCNNILNKLDNSKLGSTQQQKIYWH